MLLEHGKASLFFVLRLSGCLAGADQHIPLRLTQVAFAPATQIGGTILSGELSRTIVIGQE
eukprot:25179-Eustigmatos_ZCMA.PRE.1